MRKHRELFFAFTLCDILLTPPLAPFFTMVITKYNNTCHQTSESAADGLTSTLISIPPRPLRTMWNIN
ncbi:hypothetical protein KIN20_021932 [Parelaphostrongylus tenuis]|uniref:Uncharacterized protein n=1 Tax=Parelaphostrongylus tenuis TaxID=148309 RepID=A0AAD5QRX0_PARTN|nr:hypothetical protein KIN20_021932 [Parelaphostrongylus tenuis]